MSFDASSPVELLELPRQISNSLRAAEINTVGELLNSPDDLILDECRKIGRKRLRQIDVILNYWGLKRGPFDTAEILSLPAGMLHGTWTIVYLKKVLATGWTFKLDASQLALLKQRLAEYDERQAGNQT